jgi:hypothetical protein
MNWSATFTLNAGVVQDQEYVPFYVEVADSAGQVNTYDSATENLEDVLYYAPIEINNLTLHSTNEKNPQRYIKDGDTITVSFGANHEIVIDTPRIANLNATVTEDRNSNGEIVRLRLLHTVQNGQMADEQMLTFNMSITDVAGNTAVVLTQADVANEVQYFAPLQASTYIRSNGRYTDYAKNGDTVTVHASLNHNAEVVTGSIGGRSAGVGLTGKELDIQYTIPEGEASIPEGELGFSYTVEDVAGNTLTINTVSSGTADNKVIYDRTAPEMAFAPVFNGFANTDVSMSVIYTDENLDGSGFSILVNGGQTAANVGDIRNAGTYTYTVSFSRDGEYVLRISAIDMAGNETTMELDAFVVIDKTAPSIQLRNRTVRTYRGGFTLDEIFIIDEDYIREVVCVLTDSVGVHELSLNTPIEEDGKKTVTIIATDMAGNASLSLTTDFYIDSTLPKPIIIETLSLVEIFAENNNVIRNNTMQLSIHLENLHVGDEAPDHFTVLKVMDANGNIVADLLNSEDGSYIFETTEKGEYSLIVNAVDDVGNETDEIIYPIRFQSKNIFIMWFENTPLFVCSIIGATAMGGITIRNKRKKALPDNI